MISDMNKLQRWDEIYAKGEDFSLISSATISDILQYLPKELKGQKCLDIGSGTGQLTRELYHRGFQKVTGIDASVVAIDIARSLTTVSETKLDYIAVDIEENPQLAPHSFHLITCKLVYAFIKDKPSFLDWVQAHLHEHGIFALITPLDTDVPKEKKNIAVNKDSLISDLQERFKILATQHVKSGLLVICSSGKSNRPA